jgi:hypothetical protein
MILPLRGEYVSALNGLIRLSADHVSSFNPLSCFVLQLMCILYYFILFNARQFHLSRGGGGGGAPALNGLILVN